jgi:hypothetical protein
VFSAVKNLADWSGSTFYGAARPGEALPNVVIRIDSDTFREDLNAMSTPLEIRELSMVVEIREDGSYAPAETLDDYAIDIESAIYNSTGVTSVVMEMRTNSIDFDYSDEAEQSIGLVTMNFSILYEEDAPSPLT